MDRTLSVPVILTGYKEHGKDEACKLLGDLGLTSVSSSWYACQKFIFDTLKDDFGYATPQECYDDRRDKRDLWFRLIRDYNDDCLTRLADEIFEDGYDIYNGLRNREEFEAIKQKYPDLIVVWIDALDRKPAESADSMELSIEDAHLIIDNNGSIEDLRQQVFSIHTILTGVIHDQDCTYQARSPSM